MKWMNMMLILLLFMSTSCNDDRSDDITVENLACEYMKRALVAKAKPRFNWEISSAKNEQVQTAWQVIVSTDSAKIEAGAGDMWDSGKTEGSETFNIEYNGERLHSFSDYYWRVRSWDKDGKVSAWSKTARFITGAFDKNDWKGHWIGDVAEPPLDYPLVYKHIGYLSSYTDNKHEEKWVQVDLKTSQPFDRIVLYPSYNNIKKLKDYYFPVAYNIALSEDGNTWQKLLEQKFVENPQGKPVVHEFKEVQARFIRLVATELRYYKHRIYDYEDRGDKLKLFAFSLAEMEILRNDRILSKDCKVACKDAVIKIDREDGYDPDMLTDGIRNTPQHPERRQILPCPLLRKTIVMPEKPVKALAYVSALGVYEIAFNTARPDNNVLAPEWTDYHKRVQYQVYDVTDLLMEGTNVISAQLADGWYAGMLGPTRWSPYFPKRGGYGLDRRLFFQMEVTYKDGHEETIVSDGSWKIYPDGPVRLADNFLGETYDANKEVPGWQSKAFNDADWKKAVVDDRAEINLVPQTNQPIRVLEILDAKQISQTKEGYYLIDVGENIAGWCRVKLNGSPGDVIVLRHGEILDDEGELYTENLSAAIQTDTVILGSSGSLTYEPRFTYHGFRYVEVRGLRQKPDKDILQAMVVASEQPRSGDFSCSNPLLNQLYKNINRSHISNMHSIPTDCPQRDERCGWMGDVFIFAQTSMFNRNMAAFYTKWMQDIFDAQSERGTFPDIAPHPFGYEKHFTNAPGWADAAVKLPYLMYLNYGDKKILENNFEAYKRYIDHIHRLNPGLIWKRGLGLNYGDWLNGNTLRAEGFPKTGAQIPSEVFATIMFFNSTKILSSMAEVIGRDREAEYYTDLCDKIKQAFIQEFVDDQGRIEGDAQACYAMALFYGLYTVELEQLFEKRMLEKFIPYEGRLNTGFHSTLPLMKELVKRGYSEKAFELLETQEFPSWGYSIAQGATSIWERWDGYVKGRGFQGAGMNSFNHYAFGAVGEWMYENILGIRLDPDSPGFRHVILKPLPQGSLTWAEGSYHSISGKIEVKWQKEENKFDYLIVIPANTSASVYMPSGNAGQVWLDGKKLADTLDSDNITFEKGYTKFTLGSGRYALASTL